MDVAATSALVAYQRGQAQETPVAPAVAASQARAAGEAPKSATQRAARPAADTLELSADANVQAPDDSGAQANATRRAEDRSSQAAARDRRSTPAAQDPQVAQTEADKAYGRAQQDVTQQVLTAQDASARVQAATLNFYA